MRALMALSIAIAILPALLAGTAASAQDAIPETPPELRGFRLDPERPAPQPQPEPTTDRPVVAPPPAVSTVPEREAVLPRPQPIRQNTERRTATPAAPIAAPERAAAEVQPDITEPAIINEAPETAAPQTEPVAMTSATAVAFWQIAAALGLTAILLLGVYWFRRRRKIKVSGDAPHIAPDYFEPNQPIKPTPIITTHKQERPAKKPRIALDFVPEKATISFTTLTIKGQLRLINEGDAAAKNMVLRAGLISASAQQQAAIEAFNADIENVPTESIGEAKSGERIGMAIEMSVPLSDMQSFPLGGQKLFVPIMVAALTYRGSDKAGTEIVQIACMIGREANPPVQKMGPLRLDLGPRSFASLGQRLIYA